MKFLGSKRRIVKDILPIMLKGRRPGQWWVEPFVGGGNVTGSDANYWVIKALELIRDHSCRKII